MSDESAARGHPGQRRLLVSRPARRPTCPTGLHALFAKARERLGFVPNVFTVWAFRPERLSAWFTHFRSLHELTENLGGAAAGR